MYLENTCFFGFVHRCYSAKPQTFSRQRDTNLFALLYGWFLATISKQLEVPPGSEFRQAYEEARKLDPPARVLLVSLSTSTPFDMHVPPGMR